MATPRGLFTGSLSPRRSASSRGPGGLRSSLYIWSRISLGRLRKLDCVVAMKVA